MPKNPKLLESILGYSFVDISLLDLALRHASIASSRKQSNERLEFLGDRVLGISIAEILFSRFPDEDEGGLARRFSGLTSREGLAKVAETIDLMSYIHAQVATRETESRSHASVTSDTLEAILGAIYLDGGLTPAKSFIATHWETMIDADLTPPKDAKTALQEWAQARGLGLPTYTVQDQTGPDHAPVFTISVAVLNHDEQIGTGRSRRLAEQDAATALLIKLETIE